MTPDLPIIPKLSHLLKLTQSIETGHFVTDKYTLEWSKKKQEHITTNEINKNKITTYQDHWLCQTLEYMFFCKVLHVTSQPVLLKALLVSFAIGGYRN